MHATAVVKRRVLSLIAALADRRPVQDVLPDVEPARRELLISGTHPDCWARAFG